MMKRMAYKDETGYHLQMDLDDSPVKRLFELEEEAARRENALALVEMRLESNDSFQLIREGSSRKVMELMLNGLARTMNEIRVPEATDRQLADEVYSILIELLAKERSNVLC